MLKKLFKPVLIALSLLALYALLGFKLLPYLLKTKLPELISEQTHYPATLSQVEFNPFTLELSANGFDLKDKQKKDFLNFSRLFVDINGFESIKNLALVIEELQLDKLQTTLAVYKDGRFNFSDLIPPDTNNKPAPEQEPFPFLLKKLQLTEGALTWHDQRLSHPETATLIPINLTLKNLSLRKDSTAQVSLSTQLEVGGKIDWQLSFSPNPLSAKGTIQLTGIKAERLWALFLQDQVNFKLPHGDADLGFAYQLDMPTGSTQLLLSDGLFITRNLQFSALKNSKPLITLPELALRDITFDLQKQTVNIGAAAAKAPKLVITSNAANEVNYAALFASKTTPASTKKTPAPAKKPGTAEQPWLINIAKVDLNKLTAAYTNLGDLAPLQATVGALNFSVSDYKLRYDDSKLAMTAQGSSLALNKINLKNLSAQKGTPPLNLTLDALKTDLKHFSLDSTAKSLQITADNGNLSLQAVNVLDADSTPALITIPELSLKGTRIDLAKQVIAIAKLQSSGAKLRAWLTEKGEINYVALFGASDADTKATPEKSTKQAENAPSWKVTLSEFDVQKFQVDFQDKTTQKPVNITLSDLSLNANNLSTEQGKKLPFTLKTTINRSGHLNLQGDTVLEPFSLNAQTTLKNIGLATFQPYVNDFAKIDIVDGALDTSAKIIVSQKSRSDDVQVQAKGNANVKKLLTRDQLLNKDLITWHALKLNAIDFTLAPLSLTIKNILVQKPYARVTIKKDTSLNFDDVIIQQAADKSNKKTSPTKKSTPFHYKIGAVTIANGSSDFSDFSLLLPFVVKLNDLDGKMERLASNQKHLTDFSLAGKVFDLSPMNLEGEFSPDFSKLDIGMHFKGTPLPFISPYMVEFAGYKIEKGKMSLDLHYKITDRKLAAENNLVLDQLTLGEKVENPKATSLPLDLAITLLKDGDGKININLPLTGSLDDPQFSVSSLVFDAFVNVLTKVISSPFKALGSLVDSDADLSTVAFKAGSDTIDEEQQEKLNQLIKGLAQKTALSVEIKGAAYTKQDWPAMQEAALLDQLKAIKAKELKADGEKKLAEYVELSEDDYERLLADLFIKKFPQLGERSFFGTPQLIGSEQDFETVAKQRLSAIIKPDQHKLSGLAATRARNIARYLINKGTIAHERIFILDSTVQAESSDAEMTSELSLKMQ